MDEFKPEELKFYWDTFHKLADKYPRGSTNETHYLNQVRYIENLVDDKVIEQWETGGQDES